MLHILELNRKSYYSVINVLFRASQTGILHLLYLGLAKHLIMVDFFCLIISNRSCGVIIRK